MYLSCICHFLSSLVFISLGPFHLKFGTFSHAESLNIVSGCPVCISLLSHYYSVALRQAIFDHLVAQQAEAINLEFHFLAILWWKCDKLVVSCNFLTYPGSDDWETASSISGNAFYGAHGHLRAGPQSGFIKLAAQNWQLWNFGASFFSTKTTIYLEHNHKHVFTYWNMSLYPCTVSWELYWGEWIQLYAFKLTLWEIPH